MCVIIFNHPVDVCILSTLEYFHERVPGDFITCDKLFYHT